MRAYSRDLRLRVLAAVDRGVPRAAVARLFDVSPATIKRWLRRRRATGGVAPRPRPGRPPENAAALRAGLLPQLEAHPDATLEDHCRRWEAAHGMPVSTATMSRVIAGHFGWTRKKRA
jgi:transposase